MADAAGKGSAKRKPRQRPPRKKTPPAATTSRAAPSDSSAASTGSSSSAGIGLGLERDTSAHGADEHPRDPQPAQPPSDEDYVAPPVELVEWTPERAGMIVRSGGYLLHSFDPVSREPGGDDLWRSTEADVDAIAPPLARILNRYEPARALAGMSDEAELAFGVIGYVRANLAQRGRVLSSLEERAPETEWPPQDETLGGPDAPDDTGTLGGTFGAPSDE